MWKATVDVTVAPNLAQRRAIMSKSIALGLLGAGAILLWDTADRVFRCAKPHAVGWGRSHPHRRCTARSHAYALHGSDTGAHSHTHTDGCAYTYARGSDDHPIGVGASCARFMRRWNLRYPRAGHRLVGRQHLSFVEVRLRRNRLRAERRGVGYEARQRADAAFVATLRGWGGIRVRGVRQRPPKARQTAHGSEAGEPARRTLVKRGLDDD